MIFHGGEPALVFFSYAHQDERLRDELAVHLAMLKREGTISEWHDRRISPGQEWGGEIDAHLAAARVILLLVSPDFLASDYCYDIEVRTAMRRHDAGEARVVPVILRPCDWSRAPFGRLQVLPKDAEPVTRWADRDEAFLDVANGIRRVAEEMAPAAVPPPAACPRKSSVSSLIPRSPAIGFVSRRDEDGHDILGRLREELSPEQGRLVALWGPGGSGKTTLAAEAARRLSAAFPGRVVWTSALGRTEVTLSTLLDDVATQLGRPEIRQQAADEKEAQVHALADTAPTLVVLDNFEAVARDDGADEQARCLDFLASCGTCSALLTTRDFVERVEVVNVGLAAMDDDEAGEFLDRLIERSGRPEAFLGLDHGQLVRECEANPLVMQWVVSRVALARRVRDVLADLRQGQGDAAERVFHRSFMLPQVGEDGRAALLALSLFAPDASREALAHVSGFGDDLHRLDRAVEDLSALWLVEATEGHERLFLRGLTRELTRSRLARDARAQEFHQRFIAYFVAWAEAREAPSSENYEALEAEKDNLLSAADLAFARSGWESVWTIADVCALPVIGVLAVRGFWDEAVRLNERALQGARLSGQQEWVAYFAQNLGGLQGMRGLWEEARRLFEESLDIYRSLGNDRRLAQALHNLAMIAQQTGTLDEARRLYHDSLEIGRRVGDQRVIAGTFHQLAMLALESGDLDQARTLYQESLDIEKKLGNQHGIAASLHELGRLAHRAGDYAEARRLCSESLAILRGIRNKPDEANALAHLALLDAAEGKLGDAVEHAAQAEEIMVQLGNQVNVLQIREKKEAFQALLRKQETASHNQAAGGTHGDRQP